MRAKSQVIRDESRETYSVTFPTELDADRVVAWLRSVSATLPKRSGKVLSRDTMVFETWATSAGFTHRLMVPDTAAEYIASQLRTHGRGITVTKDDTRPSVDWTMGVNVGMSSPLRQLSIKKHADLSASLLGAVQALQGDEQVLIQWVIHPAKFERPPTSGGSSSADFHPFRALLNGPAQASNDEIADRRKKLEEPNLLGIGRIVAKADKEARARELILRVDSALGGASSIANYFKTKPHKNVIAEAESAASVMLFPNQFTLSELAAVIAWPIGMPFVAGLTKGATRTLFAPADVASEGRPLGTSTFEGHERPLALPYDLATQHMVVVGSSGTGKSVMLANAAVHDIKEGFGVWVIDAGDSRSDETLYSRVLNTIPPGHEDRVININPMEEQGNPVGFNILEQGNPRSVADRVLRIFAGLFPDSSSGIWTPQLLFHGVFTLAERGGLTFPDIIPLLNPKTPDEVAWSEEITSNVKDRDVREWWVRWKSFEKSERDRNIAPLYNRIWNIVNRPEVRNIIGQAKSTFDIKDALENNKVVLINLAGADEETAKILSAFFLDSGWSVARQGRPDKANFWYLDEFQVMLSSQSLPLDDLLSRSRKHNLGLVMATQHFSDRVPREVKSAAINNARTQVVFRVANDEARLWNAEFDQHVDAENIKSQKNYDAYAKVASATGQTSVSLRGHAPAPPTGTAQRVIQLSRKTYGRPITDVEAERDARRKATENPKGPRTKIGYEDWTQGEGK